MVRVLVHSRAMPLLRLVGTVCLCAGLGGCWVAPPRPDEWMRVGFRGPEQAFASFQVAVRADEPELEYRCFSDGFRQRNHISKMAWREARIELRRQYPWLKKGIADARIETLDPRGDRAHAVLETHGERIEIEFVREDFAELWAGTERIADEYVPFDSATNTQVGSDGKTWFQGSVALPLRGADAAPVTEIHLAREWKIDSFRSIPPAREDGEARAQRDPRKIVED